MLAAGDASGLAEWVGGYAITLPEHRRLLEDLFASLAWKSSGQAVLVHGLYGAGKSHLLVVLHLLLALPDAWPAWLASHPIFQRFATPMQAHRRLVVHFSLDEYGPRVPLEDAVRREVTRAFQQAQIPTPVAPEEATSRLDEWHDWLQRGRDHGFDGLMLLIDELSLFLAGRAPAQREADAAFLQFLANLCGRSPIWLIGALQRDLSAVGPLRMHSWRQVEDRFRRYALSPQEIGAVLHGKLLTRTDPAAIRTIVMTEIAPAAERRQLALPAGELHQCWPFHPSAIDLLMEAAGNYLSPHRSVVDILQRAGELGWLSRPADHLVTPLDLMAAVKDDALRDERLSRLQRADSVLAHAAESAPDPALARQSLGLLILLKLADRTATVSALRLLLFDGQLAPSLDQLSQALHHLRRYGAFLAVLRDRDPAQETFALALEDEIGALALARMQEVRQSFAERDPRMFEIALQACREGAWPFDAATTGLSLAVDWCGSERQVEVSLVRELSEEDLARRREHFLSGACAAQAMLGWPGETENFSLADEPFAGVLLRWLPREPAPAEADLWTEFAAWQRVADFAERDGARQERRIQQRCRERADELRPAVAESIRALYLEGEWRNAGGEGGHPHPETTMAQTLAGMLAPGFDRQFPIFRTCTPEGVPSRAVCQQLLSFFSEQAGGYLPPQSLQAEYLERYVAPLGCATLHGGIVHLSPPRSEILTPLLELLAGGARRDSELLDFMRRPPLGLTAEQGRIVLHAAVHSGALQGLDAFLQPLPTTAASAPAFLGLPACADTRFRACLGALAARWEIPLDSWSFACSQVDRQLRGWLNTCGQRLPDVRQALTDWQETLMTMPWGWRATEATLQAIEQLLAQSSPTLDELLTILDETEEDLLVNWEQLAAAASRWTAHGEKLRFLLAQPLPPPMQILRDELCTRLAGGEEVFPELPALGERLDRLHEEFQTAYRDWHEATFGAEVVTALRDAFATEDFRLTKLLARLPLPLPESARACLEALAAARAAFCPGDFLRLASDGCCARCHLPLDSPSPLPDAARIHACAQAAPAEYAELLATHAWAEEIRQRLPRAPEPVATAARALLQWRSEEGSARLLELLDDRLLVWLCREQRVAGTRQVARLRGQLRGKDLTLREAREALEDWLDPERTLEEDCSLAFE